MAKRITLYKQYDGNDCGPTCLRMIAKYYGKQVSLQILRESTRIGKDGVNMLGISEAAETLGFKTQAIKVTHKRLVGEALLPCILYWNRNHFVVLYKIGRRRYFIADPASGLMSYTSEEFIRHWVSDKNKNDEMEGIALLLEPSHLFYKDEDEAIPSVEGHKAGLSFSSITRYILPYKRLVFQLLLGFLISSILQMFVPFLAQSIVDVGINTENLHFLYIVLIAQLALFGGRLITDFIRNWVLLHISTRINIAILTEFLIKLMRLPAAFFDSKRTGDILQRMNDHQRIESFLTGSSLGILFSLINLVVFSVILASFDLSIFSIFVFASLLYSGWVLLFLGRRKELDNRKFGISAEEQSTTIQIVQAMQEIKLNGIENTMRSKWELLQARLFRVNLKGLSLNQWQQSGAFLINEGKSIFITFLAARAVIGGQMTLGTMVAVQYIMGQLNSPIEQMIGFVQSWQNARISMDRLNEVHQLEDEEPADRYLLQELPPAYTKLLAGGRGKDLSELNPAEGTISYGEDTVGSRSVNGRDIRFKNVSFMYPGSGNEPVLKDINLDIPNGKTTAIVGVSGSGKTTLLKLLLKFYEVQKGEINLGAVPLGNISHKAWRSHCGVVMQESFLFSESIARNIAVGAEAIDMDRLQHAIAAANMEDFIAGLPLGLNTKIGPEGIGISMGQRQRVLIARSVYRNPEFILFDEATNSLDANNESIILDNLGVFFKGRTVVVVAHRLSTVKNADQIVVLNKGLITERGTHRELVGLRGEYFTLVKNQLDLDV